MPVKRRSLRRMQSDKSVNKVDAHELSKLIHSKSSDIYDNNTSGVLLNIAEEHDSPG